MRITAIFLAAACLPLTAPVKGLVGMAQAQTSQPASRPAPVSGRKTLAMVLDENKVLRAELDAAGPRGLQRIKELEHANKELAKQLNIRQQRIQVLLGDVQRLKQQITYLEQRLARPQRR